PAYLRVVADPLRPAQVLLEYADPVVAGQDRAAVRDRDRVGVHVHHPRVRCDLVHVAAGGDTRPDVEELGYPGGDEEAYRPAQESPAGVRLRDEVRYRHGQLPEQLAVDREVVRPAQRVVVQPGRTRALHVDLVRCPVRPLHALPLSTADLPTYEY